MDLSHNEFITTMPDVSAVQNLRELRLDKCKNLIEVHESVGFLKKLAHLSASGCIKLKSFLHRMFLPSLEVLDLNLCARLEHFPDIVNNMNKPLKIYLINTAIKELPDSIGNLIGLVCIEIPSSTKLKYLPSSLFTLPNVVAFKMGGCSQLRESFRRFAQSPSAANGCRAKTLNFGNGGLSDEDLQTILNCFPKLEELIASENNFVSLPACIKESIHLTSLDVSVCKKLQEIPECTNLRILNVHRCVKLKYISELPSTIQKVDARYCFSLTKETLDMLWYQVSKEIRGLEIVMPQTEIAERFDFIDNGGNPRFWARGKFPVFALALVFRDVNEKASNSRRQLVELQLIINGQCVPHKGYYSFRIAADHVLVCDLRLLFSEEEWKGLDAFLVHDWNLVLVSYEAPSTMTLSCWGVFMYKQETNMEDVQFMCPDPIKYSDMALISPPTILRRDPKQELRKMIDHMCLDEMFDGMLMETMDYEKRDDFADKDFAVEQMHVLMGGLKEISTQAKDVLEGKAVANRNSTLAMFLEAMKKLDEEDKKDGQETIFFKDLALIRLKDGVKSPMKIAETSTSGHQGSSSSDPQQQEIIMEIFSEGMVAGLLEAQNSFPTLDIETIMHAALEKGNRVRWSSPESEVENPVDQVERKIYMEGVINGLLEAQLSFPTLDIQATLDAVLLKYGGKPPNEVGGEASSSSHQQESSETQSNDPEQRKIMMEMFWDGVLDGLNEVKNKFPSLHIGRTVTDVFNKGNRVRCSNPGTPMEKRIYIEGIVNGLLEAQLSFPTLDINATLDIVLSKGGRKVADKKGKQPMDLRDGEASTCVHQKSSEEQGIDPQQLEIMRENLWLGMLDGLLEAKSNFPTLDIETTIVAALEKGNRFKWLIPDSEIEIPEGEHEDPLARLKRKMYMEGVINGLIEAQLSFPTLNIQATADVVLSNRRGQPIVPSSDDPLLQAFKMMNQESYEAEARSKLYWNLIEEHRALRKKFEQVENGTAASDKDSCLLTWKNQYDELLEKLNTRSALSSTEMHTNITRYEKLAAVLQGRADELKRLYDASIEGFQNSEEFQDLMSVIYLYGLRDGLLEAQVVLLALDMYYMDITTPVFKENEECVVTDEAAKEVLDWTKEKVASSDDSLLQVFMMMKQESCESETKSKLYWKLIVEHKALRNKFEEIENETIALDKDSCNQYEELLEKFNTQSAEFISEKQHNLDGTEDVQEKATKISDSKSALSNTEMQKDNRKEGCRGVTKYEKLAAVLKGRDKKLQRLYGVGIEGFQNSEEFQDLMSVIYFNGLKDGLLEAQGILLALDMDRMTSPLLKENEEHVTHEAADSENLDGSISAAEIPSPTDPKVDNPPDTSESSGEEIFVNFEDFGHMFF
ncbi:Leucine-rich repeat domain superfamily [Sesbania bispinosa]|nr:Leucine-rich repeat domain superfamily [Sesbania bispinosa]